MSMLRDTLRSFAHRIRGSRAWAILAPIYRTQPVGAFIRNVLGISPGFTLVFGYEPDRAARRGQAPSADDAALRLRYETSPVAAQLDTFVLYRIIGNDIVPRHRKGQSRENLRFILENEPELEACEKRFVVNRIVDSAEEQAIRHLLESHGADYYHIPFDEAEYAREPWDLAGLPEPGYTLSAEFASLPADFRARLYKRLYRHKNNYLVNNNGARNAALEDGRSRAKWVLPWDGNCFLTEEAWEEIRPAVTARPWYPYAVVPMARVSDHEDLLQPALRPRADQEPQIIFRHDAGARFDEAFYYGRRPKVELLWRLGVPGPWDEWAIEPWDLPYPDYADDAGAWQQAGWVARLPSGNLSLDVGAGSETRRLGVRTEAVTAFLRSQDAVVLQARLQGAPPLFSDVAPHDDRGAELSRARALLTSFAEAAERPARRARWRRRRATERARNLLLDHAELPFLLDAAGNGHTGASLETLFAWLLSDAGARAVLRETGTAGTLYSLFEATIAARLDRYEDLSLALLHAADRASLLFGGAAPVLADDKHRLTWRGLDALARRAGENLWAAAPRPSELDRAVADAP